MSKSFLVFGAGDGGARILDLLTSGHDVVAFSDNDPKKIGREFCGKPVIAPRDIHRVTFDQVIISNVNAAAEIYDQLVNDLNVSPDRIADLTLRNTFDTRLGTLRLIAAEIHERKVEGCCAELGVFKGEFARYISECFPDRTLYLFDTFEGFDARDTDVESRERYSTAAAGQWAHRDVQSVLDRIIDRHRCVVRKGYFPESASGLNDTFAFVHIDVDLYAPIYDGLQYFYPRLNAGGYMLVHDYNSTRFGGVKEAVRKFAKEHRIAYAPVTDVGGSIVIAK